MKIKKQKIYTSLFYVTILAYMLGPALAYRAGLPRIDNPLTILIDFTVVLIAIYESKVIPAKILTVLPALLLMAWWSGLHFLISPLTQIQMMDILFFMAVPALFYLMYLIISGMENPLPFIRKVIVFFTLGIVTPPVIEVMTGFQFVQANETLTITSGIIKGFFFNPNNLGTAALCFAPAVLFFFNNIGETAKIRRIGWILFLALGGIIFASASRTATLCYIILFILNLVYRNNTVVTALMAMVISVILSLIPKEWIGQFLLSLNGNVFIENIASRLYLFLFDLGSDNSVGYRQEIYNYFWQNPPLLLTGYGPKNFGEYFGGHLSDSLAFENPHSFIIELYLGFGLPSLIGFAAYVVCYIIGISTCTRLNAKMKFTAFAAMGIFLLAGFIPSTILRMPFIWFPCFMMFVYSIWLATHQTKPTNYLHSKELKTP